MNGIARIGMSLLALLLAGPLAPATAAGLVGGLTFHSTGALSAVGHRSLGIVGRNFYPPDPCLRSFNGACSVSHYTPPDPCFASSAATCNGGSRLSPAARIRSTRPRR
jgi:hypothetical protein